MQRLCAANCEGFCRVAECGPQAGLAFEDCVNACELSASVAGPACAAAIDLAGDCFEPLSCSEIVDAGDTTCAAQLDAIDPACEVE